jgi:hypothetical protein
LSSCSFGARTFADAWGTGTSCRTSFPLLRRTKHSAVRAWAALPLSDTALDARYHEGSRLEEFHNQQFRLRVLSVFLHEVNHLVFPREPESSVRERSLTFYRESLAHFVESTISTMSLTIDRSFSRLG